MTPTGLISAGVAVCAPVVIPQESPCLVKQWELVEFAGSGSLADVYRARPAGSRGSPAAGYAVKILRPEWEGNPQAIRLLQREATVGRIFKHPHLAPVLASSVRESPRLLAMPWLEGSTLRAQLDAERCFDVSVALWIARQTAEALDALHSAGWMHGDVTPGNIFIAPSGHVTLIDLSFARRRDEFGTAADRPVMGTCRYIAPEYLTSAYLPDIRSDIYSLGAMLYELFAGVPPYPAADLSDLATMQRQTAPPLLSRLAPHVPREVVRLISSMIAKDPIRRLQSPRELIERLIALEIGSFSARA